MAKIDALVDELEATIPQALAQRGVPGLAVGICDADQILWSAGFGSTRQQGGASIDTSTIFSVQSTSKMYTATAVMLAVQQSMLDLDAPITTYLPEFSVNSTFEPHPARRMTLRHLLSHTAGFTHEAPVGSNYLIGRDSFEAHCRSISDTWLRFPVGHHYEYSNLGIDLAGYMLQRTAGVSFASYLRRELFEPLGLARSTFDLRAISSDRNRAIGHTKGFQRANRPLPLKIPMVAAGGLYTSVQDALRYVQFHLRSGEQLLDAGLLAEQYRIPYPAPGQEYGYGLGVQISEWDPGVRVYHHGGAGFGFLSQLCWVPELSMGAVVLTNSFDHSLENEIAGRIVQALVPARGRGPSAEVESAGRRASATKSSDGDATAQDVSDLTGEYIGRLSDRAEVFTKNGRLFVRDSELHEATIDGSGTLVLQNTQHQRYRFLPDDSGRVAYMQSLRDGQVRYKNDRAATPASTLDPEWEGTYVLKWSGVPRSQCRIFQDGDSPVIEMSGDDEDPSASSQPMRLHLTQVAPGLYRSSMGEMLDVRQSTPTYANIRLTKVR